MLFYYFNRLHIYDIFSWNVAKRQSSSSNLLDCYKDETVFSKVN